MSQKTIAPLPRISFHAFWETEETCKILQQVAEDPRMARVHLEISSGGLPHAINHFQSTPAPNLILIEAKMDRQLVFEQLDALAELCDFTTKVIVLGDINDVQLYRDLMARGISEYLIAPVTSADVVHAIAHLYADPVQRLIGRVVAVCGAKGGCGSSTLAHNLATTIGRMSRQMTMIIDLDMAFGTASLNFNQDPPSTITDALQAGERLDTMFVERLLVKCEEHVALLPAPADLDLSQSTSLDMLEFILDAARSLAHVIILDIPHGWSDWKRNVLLNANEVILVSEPDLASLRNTKNLIDFLRAARPEDLQPHLILNKMGMSRRPEIAASDFEKALSLRPSAVIPHQPKIFGLAANYGQPIADVEGSAKIQDILNKFAGQLAGPAVLSSDHFSRLKIFIDEWRKAIHARIG